MEEKTFQEQEAVENFGTAALMMIVSIGAIVTMKSISDSARENRGEKRETWLEWITRGL
jgi:hypothetical protein